MKKTVIASICIISSCMSLSTLSHAVDTTQETRSLQRSANNIFWLKKPSFRFSEHELRQQNRQISVVIHGNEKGEVTLVNIAQSSGLPELDKKVVRAVYQSKFRPYKENGVAIPFTAEQPFNLKLSTATFKERSPVCAYHFESEVWNKQQSDQSTPFRYKTQPRLTISSEQLAQQSRNIEFSFKLSRKNEISQVEISKSSGVNLMDSQIKYAVTHASITAPRKFWQFYKLKFNDRIYFDINHCTSAQ